MMDRVTLRGSLLAVLLAAGFLGGCVDRKIRITSEPPGARVWLNDVEIGTTPAEADFRFYGRYDVRLEKDGYEPLWTDREAVAPIWQWPVLDIAAELVPARFDDVIDWHFDLQPSLETLQTPEELRAGLIERAHELRRETVTDQIPEEGVAEPDQGSPPSGV